MDIAMEALLVFSPENVKKAPTGTNWNQLAPTGTNWNQLASTGTNWNQLAHFC